MDMPHPTGVLSVDILRGRNLVKMDLQRISMSLLTLDIASSTLLVSSKDLS